MPCPESPSSLLLPPFSESRSSVNGTWRAALCLQLGFSTTGIAFDMDVHQAGLKTQLNLQKNAELRSGPQHSKMDFNKLEYV